MSERGLKTRFVCIRHGEAKIGIGEKRLIAGQHYDTGLTENGRRQAQVAKEDLRRRFPDMVMIAVSILPRAKETADILFSDIPRITYPGLKERYNGTQAEEHKQPREEFTRSLLARREEIAERVKEMSEEELEHYPLVEGMETTADLNQRIDAVFIELAQLYPGATIGVVFHGDALRSWMMHHGYGNRRILRTGSARHLCSVVAEYDGGTFAITEVSGINKSPDDGLSNAAEGLIGYFVKGI